MYVLCYYNITYNTISIKLNIILIVNIMYILTLMTYYLLHVKYHPLTLIYARLKKRLTRMHYHYLI